MRKEFGFSEAFDIECFLSAFEANYSPGYYFNGEYHDFREVVYVLSDRLGVSADDRIFDLSEGDMIFHKPMEFHRLRTLDGLPAHIFIMSFRLTGELSDKLHDRVIHLSSHQRELVHDLIAEFSQNARHNFENDETLYVNEFSEKKVTDFMRNWQDSSPANLTIKYKT